MLGYETLHALSFHVTGNSCSTQCCGNPVFLYIVNYIIYFKNKFADIQILDVYCVINICTLHVQMFFIVNHIVDNHTVQTRIHIYTRLFSKQFLYIVQQFLYKSCVLHKSMNEIRN